MKILQLHPPFTGTVCAKASSAKSSKSSCSPSERLASRFPIPTFDLTLTLTLTSLAAGVRLHAGDHVDRGAKATPHAPLLYGQAWSVQASGQRDCGDNRPCQHHPSHGERLFPLQVNFISNHITFLGMIQHHKTSLIPPWTTYLCALCRYSIHHLITTSLYLKQHPT